MDARLMEWRHWLLAGSPLVAGYPGRTLEKRLRDEGGVLISGSGARVAPSNERAEQVEVALLQMPETLRETVFCKYRSGLMDHDGAQRLSVSLTGYKERLQRAYHWLDGRLASSAMEA
jgi:DNA-directed RNA polymerase specialized sigma24 family protein